MRQLFRAAIPLSLILWGPAPETRAQDDGVQLHVVKYEGLKATVLKNRGKVVVVDVWADFCIPCKKNMPHLVELAQKYSDKGLAVITVSIDQWRQEPDAKD